MKTISKDINNIKEINKSKFINYLFKVDKLEDIKIKLEKLRKEYNDATHICYAYILDSKEKAVDDGEPSGTAGRPILDILKKNDLEHVLAVSVRYFGGIKLGAGGLLRAYANSINDLVKASTLVDLVDGYLVRFEISYDKVKLIDNMNIKVKYQEFDLNIIYEAIIKKEDIDTIKNLSLKFEILDNIKTSF